MLHQAYTAYSIGQTLSKGTQVTATITDLYQSSRVDVSYDYVSLRIPMPDGTVLVRERLSLPHSLAPLINDQETVVVDVLPGATQEVVITKLADTQQRIALMNTAICLVAFLLTGVGVYYWNRMLTEKGDPSERGVVAPDPSHPARQVVR